MHFADDVIVMSLPLFTASVVPASWVMSLLDLMVTVSASTENVLLFTLTRSCCCVTVLVC